MFPVRLTSTGAKGLFHSPARLLPFCLVFLLQWSSVFAETLGFESSGALFSRDVFRGITRYRGGSLQPRIELESPLSRKSSILGEVSAKVPIQGERRSKEFSEYRVTGAYRLRPGAGDVLAGGTWYSYGGDIPPPPGNTGEIFGILAFSAVINPSFSLYQDFDETYSRYFEIGFHEEFPTDYYDRDVVFTPFVKLGYGFHTKDHVYGQSGFNHYDLGLRASSDFDAFRVFAEVIYTGSSDVQVDDTTWAGIGISYRVPPSK